MSLTMGLGPQIGSLKQEIDIDEPELQLKRVFKTEPSEEAPQDIKVKCEVIRRPSVESNADLKLEFEQIFVESCKTEYLPESDSLPEFKCEKCSYVTTYPSELQNHLVNHQGTPWFCCEKCDFKTNREHSLIKHEVKSHSRVEKDKGFKCDLCQQTYTSKFVLKMHEERLHPEVVEHFFFCEDCDYKTTKWKLLHRHNMRKHPKKHQEWYKCTLCPSESKWEKVIKNHVLIRHSDNRTGLPEIQVHWLQCDFCSNCFKTPLGWIRHVLKRHDGCKTWFRCVCCKFESKEANFLRMHVFKEHADMKCTFPQWLRCSKCRYKTTLGSRMKRHSLQHLSELYERNSFEICNETKSEEQSVDGSFEYEPRFYKRRENLALKERIGGSNTNIDSESEGYSCSHCSFRAKKNFELKLHSSLMHPKL